MRPWIKINQCFPVQAIQKIDRTSDKVAKEWLIEWLCIEASQRTSFDNNQLQIAIHFQSVVPDVQRHWLRAWSGGLGKVWKDNRFAPSQLGAVGHGVQSDLGSLYDWIFVWLHGNTTHKMQNSLVYSIIWLCYFNIDNRWFVINLVWPRIHSRSRLVNIYPGWTLNDYHCILQEWGCLLLLIVAYCCLWLLMVALSLIKVRDDCVPSAESSNSKRSQNPGFQNASISLMAVTLHENYSSRVVSGDNSWFLAKWKETQRAPRVERKMNIIWF